MSKGFKVTLAVLVAVGLLTVSLGSVVSAASPAGANTLCPNFDTRQGGRLGGFYCEGTGIGFRGEGVIEAVCQLLEITPDELQTLRLEGNSLVEIAATKGISEDALVEAIMEVKRAFIQEQVEAGILTQEQAELMLQQMEQRTIEMVNRTSVGPFCPMTNGAGSMGNRASGNSVGAMADTPGGGWGDPSDCTGPGGMHHWGKKAR